MKRDEPSGYFLGAILRGYDAELEAGHVPTVSGIWNRVVMECIQRNAWETMFRWDTSKAKDGANRVRDIAECLHRGLVPGLELATDAKGREVVRPRRQGGATLKGDDDNT